MSGPAAAAEAAAFALRPAGPDDEALILGWRNDPFIVGWSSSRNPVAPDEHSRWYAETLRSPNRRILIVLIGGEPAGLVRFDRDAPARAVISVYLLERFTGRGHGVRAIRDASAAIVRDWPVDVHAHVRADNRSGQAAFVKAGFALDATAPPMAGHVTFVLPRGRS